MQGRRSRTDGNTVRAENVIVQAHLFKNNTVGFQQINLCRAKINSQREGHCLGNDWCSSNLPSQTVVYDPFMGGMLIDQP